MAGVAREDVYFLRDIVFSLNSVISSRRFLESASSTLELRTVEQIAAAIALVSIEMNSPERDLRYFAAHIHDIGISQLRGMTPVHAVERVARFQASGRARESHVLASKFLHYFVDARIMIFDSYSEEAARELWGRRRRGLTHDGRYSNHMARVDAIFPTMEIERDAVAVDCFLWLAGNWLALKRAKSPKLLGELVEVLMRRQSEIDTVLLRYLPQ